jgi:S1-C subfamily serine protease
MRRPSLYSSSNRSRAPVRSATPAAAQPEPQPQAAPAAPEPRRSWLRRFAERHDRALFMLGGALLAGAIIFSQSAMNPPPRPLTQKDLDNAVLRTLQTKPLPSRAAEAYEIVKESVVRVRGLGRDGEPDKDSERSVGTGVVILDDGTILTNLHVVLGAKRINVIFPDGTESDATIVGAEPQHDLAVIKAKTLPDDLAPATLRSTADLRLGDEVVAVGFPFGIGPSVSSGVVSGLRREYRSPEGKRLLTNLIQFDAAANPGSSGGPLITTDGEVVGIVTAILNPNDQAVFIGIGFAVPIENAAAAVGLSPF